MLASEHLASAAESDLNFVGDQDHIMFVTDLPDLGEELYRGDDRAALALHRFDNDRSRFAHPGVRIFEHVIQVLGTLQVAFVRSPVERTPIAIRVRNEVDLRRQRKKRFSKMTTAGEGKSPGGHAMIGTFEGNDGLSFGVVLRQLDGRFDCVGTRGPSERKAAELLWEEPRQLLNQELATRSGKIQGVR